MESQIVSRKSSIQSYLYEFNIFIFILKLWARNMIKHNRENFKRFEWTLISCWLFSKSTLVTFMQFCNANFKGLVWLEKQVDRLASAINERRNPLLVCLLKLQCLINPTWTYLALTEQLHSLCEVNMIQELFYNYVHNKLIHFSYLNNGSIEILEK